MSKVTWKHLYEEDRDLYNKLVAISGSEELTDSAMGHPDMLAYALLALKTQDLANLQIVTHSMPNVRNHGVAIRKLIAREAKRVREGANE